jgi:mannose-1-phosphate guanylyltransferase
MKSKFYYTRNSYGRWETGYGLYHAKASKQYLDLFDGKSLFEMTVDRNRSWLDTVDGNGKPDNCHLEKILEKSGTYVDIIETTQNTAAAIAFAALLQIRYCFNCYAIWSILLMVTLIMKMINEAVEKASQGYIVTLLFPLNPETGYGYIERSVMM